MLQAKVEGIYGLSCMPLRVSLRVSGLDWCVQPAS